MSAIDPSTLTRGQTFTLVVDGFTRAATLEAYDGKRAYLMARNTDGKNELIGVDPATLSRDGTCSAGGESGAEFVRRQAIAAGLITLSRDASDVVDSSLADTIGTNMAALPQADRQKVCKLLTDAIGILNGGKSIDGLNTGARTKLCEELDAIARHLFMKL